jgi:HEAT repeat protein
MSPLAFLLVALGFSAGPAAQPVWAFAVDCAQVSLFAQASGPCKWRWAALVYKRESSAARAAVDRWYVDFLKSTDYESGELEALRAAFLTMRLHAALPLLENASFSSLHLQVVEELLLRDPEASLGILIERLRHADKQACVWFPRHLRVLARRIGSEVARRVALAPARRHKDPKVRRAVLDGLLGVSEDHDLNGIPEFFDALAEAGKDEDPELRAMVANEAYRFEARRVLPTLSVLIEDAGARVQVEALESLAVHVVKDSSLVSPGLDASLRRLLGDERFWVRLRAAMVLLLRNVEDEEAVRTVADDLKSDDDHATGTALALLERWKRKPARLIPGLIEALLQDMGEVAKRPRDVLRGSKSRNFEMLAKFLSAYGTDAARAIPILELVIEKIVRELDFLKTMHWDVSAPEPYYAQAESAYKKITTEYLLRLGADREKVLSILLRDSEHPDAGVRVLAQRCLATLSDFSDAPAPR